MNTKQIIGFHNPDEEYGYLSNRRRAAFGTRRSPQKS